MQTQLNTWSISNLIAFVWRAHATVMARRLLSLHRIVAFCFDIKINMISNRNQFGSNHDEKSYIFGQCKFKFGSLTHLTVRIVCVWHLTFLLFAIRARIIHLWLSYLSESKFDLRNCRFKGNKTVAQAKLAISSAGTIPHQQDWGANHKREFKMHLRRYCYICIKFVCPEST